MASVCLITSCVIFPSDIDEVGKLSLPPFDKTHLLVAVLICYCTAGLRSPPVVHFVRAEGHVSRLWVTCYVDFSLRVRNQATDFFLNG